MLQNALYVNRNAGSTSVFSGNVCTSKTEEMLPQGHETKTLEKAESTGTRRIGPTFVIRDVI